SIDCDGSITLPPRRRIDLVIGRASLPTSHSWLPALRRLGELRWSTVQQIEHGHSYCDAVRHLIENYAERSIGHIGVDLDSAIHRAGMQNENVARSSIESLA